MTKPIHREWSRIEVIPFLARALNKQRFNIWAQIGSTPSVCVATSNDEEHAAVIAKALVIQPELLDHLEIMCQMAMHAAPADCGRDQVDIDAALACVSKARGKV